MAEVLRIKEILIKVGSGKKCLVVLDEMFRGTNAKDAFEASVAVNELLRLSTLSFSDIDAYSRVCKSI